MSEQNEHRAPVDPKILGRIRRDDFRVMADIYCPTWGHEPYKGWRKILIYKLGWFCFPKRWFKPTPKYRVVYWMTKQRTAVCSPENYAAIMEALKEKP